MTHIAVNVFELFAKIALDDSDYKDKLEKSESKFSKFADGLKNGLATTAKIGAAAVGAAASAVAALTKASIENYAEYEQLVGGAKLMFGDAYDKVAENAKNAYKTVQMSQNEYLQQVNGFATGLKTALKGNESAAADLAHKIVQAEADVVAATGNTAENVQNAFNGIMKSNFTMLDNLQIGITPTKEGFQEVIDKVNAWNKANGNATKYQMGNLADMQSALVDYIDMVGMKGYAEREASQTIEGSLAMTKAAYSNLLTGLADDNANFEELVGGLVTALVGDGTEANPGLINNILPRIENALGGIGELVQKLAPIIGEQVPALVTMLLPMVLDGAMSILDAVGGALPDLILAIADSVTFMAYKLTQMLEDGLTDQKSMNAILDATEVLIMALGGFLVTNAPLLVKTAVDIIVKLASWLGDNAEQLTDMAVELIVALALGLSESLPELLPAVMDIITGIADSLLSKENLDTLGQATLEIGRFIVEGLWEAIKNLGSWFSNKLNEWFGNTMDDVKEDQEIHSPSKLWARIIGKPIGQGVGEGAVEGLDESKEHIVYKFNEMSEEVLEKVEKLANEVKDKLDEILGYFDTMSDVAELEFELWEMTEGAGASEIEKTAKKMELLTKQLNNQKQVVEATNEAYEEMVKLYGENSVQAMQYKKMLLEEQLEYEKLSGQMSEMESSYEGMALKQMEWAESAINSIKSVSSAIVESTHTAETSVKSSQDRTNSLLGNALDELIDMFTSGKAKIDVNNTRDLRRALVNG